MATQADVRRIALALPDTEETAGRFAFSVLNKGKQKAFVWVWMERINPKKPRVANPGVIAARVANVGQRDLMISLDPVKFFTEPHYAGYAAVLVRLNEVSMSDLKVLVTESWRCQAPANLVAAAPVAPKASARKRASTK